MTRPTETHTQSIVGRDRAIVLVGFLMSQSQWFEVTPYPEDRWGLTVGVENKNLLQRLAVATDDLIAARGQQGL